MCDPVSALVVGIGGAAIASSSRKGGGSTVPTTDPAAEQAAAEARAAQAANAKLAEDQRRRRTQGSLIARGATGPTLGDPEASGAMTSPLSGGRPATRSTAALRTQSLLARGGSQPSSGGTRQARATMAEY